MTPFKEKPVKWDGDGDGGRYKNKNGFKYDIVSQTMVRKAEDMPSCFLAETPQEAEALYQRFKEPLNGLSKSFAISTGLHKWDLFGEGLIGLGRAYRDWDPERSDNFEAYALFRIKDAMSEFVKANKSTITTPSYLRKANSNIKEIKNICEMYDIDYRIILEEQELPDELEVGDAVRCAEVVGFLINAANRAKISYKKLIERATLVPIDDEYQDQAPPEVHKREMEQLEAAIVVEKLKQQMDNEELFICDGIMCDKSFSQIGKELGKSKAWVSGRLKKLKYRMMDMIKEGAL
jgi:RNA polymerase sigma factor (sigma-70 family)